MNADIVAELAPTGTLRAAINMGNFLLVSGTAPSGDPEGVAPDLAGEIAKSLGVPVAYVPFASPGDLVAAAGSNQWDIGTVGAEPAREKLMSFTAAYAEIASTYLVREDAPFKSVEEIDRAGVRIIVRGQAAYGLYLTRTIKNAELITTETHEIARQRFVDEKLDALAGLRPGLLGDVEKIPGTRVLEDGFSSVQQAVGTLRANTAGIAYLHDFVEEAKASGLIARLIERHKVRGLTVAPAA